jgi:hypothetical protein
MTIHLIVNYLFCLTNFQNCKLIESWKENSFSNWTILSLNEQMTLEDGCCCDESFVNVELNEQEMNQIWDLNSKYENKSPSSSSLSSPIDCFNILSSTNTISTSIEPNSIIIDDVLGLF